MFSVYHIDFLVEGLVCKHDAEPTKNRAHILDSKCFLKTITAINLGSYVQSYFISSKLFYTCSLLSLQNPS